MHRPQRCSRNSSGPRVGSDLVDYKSQLDRHDARADVVRNTSLDVQGATSPWPSGDNGTGVLGLLLAFRTNQAYERHWSCGKALAELQKVLQNMLRYAAHLSRDDWATRLLLNRIVKWFDTNFAEVISTGLLQQRSEEPTSCVTWARDAPRRGGSVPQQQVDSMLRPATRCEFAELSAFVQYAFVNAA
eukprot:Skav222854  [mRNA]  locus=scaffold850:531023:537943:- [translate_table: standard]